MPELAAGKFNSGRYTDSHKLQFTSLKHHGSLIRRALSRSQLETYPAGAETEGSHEELSCRPAAPD